MGMLRCGLVVGGLRWVWVMHVHIRDKGVWRERQLFPSKCLQRCKRECEGPWLWLAHLTDWKQGFIFSNLWSQHRERSVKGRRGEGVLRETLGGEMKDIFEDKLSSADVDERCPANRDKWDCFDLNLTCCRKPSFALSFFLSFFGNSRYKDLKFMISMWENFKAYVLFVYQKQFNFLYLH